MGSTTVGGSTNGTLEDSESNRVVVLVQSGEVRMATYLRTAPGIQVNDAVFIKDNGEIHRVFLQDLFFLQANGSYVELHLRNGRVVLRSSLVELLRSLPTQAFVMVNRAQAINLLLVDHISPNALCIGKLSFTVSRRYRDELLERLPVIIGR